MRARILIVDDQPMFRRGLRACLEEQGFAVVAEADTREGGLAALGQSEPDLAIAGLPQSADAAISFCCDMRSARPGVRVLLISPGYPEEDEVVQAQAFLAGASGCLSRKCTGDVWGTAIAHVLSGRLLFSDEVLWTAVRGDALTGRELDVLGLLARGWDNRRIGRELAISDRTVRFHLRNIYDKIGVESRTEAAVWAVRRGIGAEK